MFRQSMRAVIAMFDWHHYFMIRTAAPGIPTIPPDQLTTGDSWLPIPGAGISGGGTSTGSTGGRISGSVPGTSGNSGAGGGGGLGSFVDDTGAMFFICNN